MNNKIRWALTFLYALFAYVTFFIVLYPVGWLYKLLHKTTDTLFDSLYVIVAGCAGYVYFTVALRVVLAVNNVVKSALFILMTVCFLGVLLKRYYSTLVLASAISTLTGMLVALKRANKLEQFSENIQK